MKMQTRLVSPEQERVPLLPYIDTNWFRSNGVFNVDDVVHAIRSEGKVMRPPSLRTIKATRLSFARTLVRRMIDERWLVEPVDIKIDENGDGTLAYRILAAG